MNFSGEAELNQWVAQADGLWFFLDYDGVLVEFKLDPDNLHPDVQVVELLNKLAGIARIRLVIISGRPLRALLALLPVPGIYLAGTYGVELQTPAGERIERVDYASFRPFLEQLKLEWQKIIAGHSGFTLEDKGWSLELHGRFAGEIETMQVTATIWQMLNKSSIIEQFRFFTGYKYLEVAPALAHKGKTVSFLMSHYHWPGAVPLYIGGDDKDEEAFETIHLHHGLTILVSQHLGSGPAISADYVLESPTRVLDWLKTLV
jgi:trehalose-phosphatase